MQNEQYVSSQVPTYRVISPMSHIVLRNQKIKWVPLIIWGCTKIYCFLPLLLWAFLGLEVLLCKKKCLYFHLILPIDSWGKSGFKSDIVSTSQEFGICTKKLRDLELLNVFRSVAVLQGKGASATATVELCQGSWSPPSQITFPFCLLPFLKLILPCISWKT